MPEPLPVRSSPRTPASPRSRRAPTAATRSPSTAAGKRSPRPAWTSSGVSS